MLGQPVFRLTFHHWYGTRRALLRLFGATVAPTARVRPSVRIEIPWHLTLGDEVIVGDRAILYALGRITLGERCMVSQGTHLCAGSHDFRQRGMPLTTEPITVEHDAWVAADVFVGPGVTIGAGAVVGARAVVVKDVPAWQVAVGHPAKPIGPRLG